MERTHPDYDSRQSAWQMALDAFEAAGGFADGGYLWPFPREEQATFEKRQSMARYHNYFETLVDIHIRAVFSQDVTRSSDSADYNAWIEDVDGAGTSLEACLKELASLALVHGHDGLLVDKTPDAPTGPTKADERARVVVRLFPALAITDWRFEQETLAAVKLIEQAPSVSITEAVPDADDARQYLIWATDGWARFDAEGQLVAADTPGLGMVPLVLLRPQPSYTSPMLARALIPDPNVLAAVYNRDSEEDHVLREQAFSLLTVSVGEGGNVADARADLGSETGTSRALIVRGAVDYKTPDQTVPQTIRDNRAYLIQELYRAAHVRFSRDSRAVESGESIRLQNAELNEAVTGLAKALQAVELQIARCYFAWQHPTPEAAEAAFQAANVSVEYPDEFFLDDLMTDLEAWAEALRLNLGETMTKRIKKKAARRIDPDMPLDVQEQVDKEIDAMKDEPAPGPADMGDPEAAAIAKAEAEMAGG